MSVPFLPRSPMPPVEMMRQIFADNFFYIVYFQEPGVADAELGADAAVTMRKLLCGVAVTEGDDAAAQAITMAANDGSGFVERMPDPGAIWDRLPLDQHSEWGRGDVRESDLQGNFLNDYVMAAMNLRAAETGWAVRSNPYEGGSDQGRFLERGIPSVLLWHFTDSFYDTNLDRIDKVSRDELENVTTAALGLVHHFVQAGAGRASEVLDIVMAAARKRLSIEANTARGFLAAPAVAQNAVQREAVLDRERHILQAWGRWYRQAVLSVEGFDPGLPFVERTELQARIDAALTELRAMERETLESLSAVPAGN